MIKNNNSKSEIDLNEVIFLVIISIIKVLSYLDNFVKSFKYLLNVYIITIFKMV
jgi:hypothetical protein